MGRGCRIGLRSKTHSADYHDEMNSERYMKWLTERLLLRLEQQTVIILDNASYHNKQKDKAPISNSNKNEIRQWLDQRNIQYSNTDIKKTQLDLVKQHRPEPLYLTDEAIHQYGHTVLRLPVAHCELIFNKLAWASVKGYVAKQNRDYNLRGVERLVPDGFEHKTADMWRRLCRHVVDVENGYFDKDGLVEDVVEEMVIQLGDDEDESEEEDEDGMMDGDARRVIDQALQQATWACSPSTSTHADSASTSTCTCANTQTTPTHTAST